jgi:hypothetical protein
MIKPYPFLNLNFQKQKKEFFPRIKAENNERQKIPHKKK